MEFTTLDCFVFIGYIVLVVGFAVYLSRKRESPEDYFLAGRKLNWWLIGISLIASSISAGHFVRMAGNGYETGLAVASYEWTAAVAMVLVSLFLLPRFLRRGIYTVPEYLESRYSSSARGLMAFFMMVAYVLVIVAAVLYAGAVGLDAIFGQSLKDYFGVEKLAGTRGGWLTSTPMQWIFGMDPAGENWVMICAVWLIGVIAGVYTVWGGLKAVVWADLFNGLGLILGGVLVTFLGFLALSTELGDGHGLFEGIRIFFDRAGDKLSAVKPYNDPEVPWIAVFIGGLWIFHLFYWGLNQSITQRALGARSVSQAQRGMMFAATLKLLIPFILIFPGIMAFELYADQIADKHQAYLHLIEEILPAGLMGVMFAVLFGAVMSSLDSMLNSASTVLTMDLYKGHLKKDASDRSLITLGRLMAALFVVIACLWAPRLGWIAGGNGIFDYIQKTWGFITPGIVTVFFFGLVSKKSPSPAAIGAMLLGIPVYAFFLWAMPEVAFLHHMAFTFIALSAYVTVVTVLIPLCDKDESAEASSDDVADGRSGLLRGRVVPYGTALIGACLLGQPIFSFSLHTFTQDPDLVWVHYVSAGVAVFIFVLAALFLLQLPAPAVRRVRAGAGEAPKRTIPAGLGRLLKFVVGGLAAAIVLAIHVYLFSSLIAPPEYWQRTLEPVIGQRSLHIGSGEAQRCIGSQDLLLGPAAIAVAGVLALAAVLVVMWLKPAAPDAELPPKTDIDLTPSRTAKIWGVIVVVLVALLYLRFR